MAVQYNSKIVTDGLVLCLDAANRKSYPGSGTTWTDLSGSGNNGSLINGVGYNSANGGSLSFDGVNDYTSIPTGTIFNFGTNDYAINIWVRFNTVASNQIFISKYLTWTGNLDFVFRFRSSDSKIGFLAGDNAPINLSTNTIIAANINYNLCISRISGTTSMYLNSILESSSNTAATIPNDRTEIRLGFSHDNDEPFNGRIYNFNVYNRGLTQAEIQQNFNALRGRYGI